MSPPSREDLFSQALSSASMTERQAAMRQLEGDKLTDESTSWIRSTLDSPDALVRRRGAALLSVLQYSASVGDLLDHGARDASWIVRDAAVESIAKHVDPARPGLMEALVDRSLHDRNHVIRDMAVKNVLLHIDGANDVNAIIDAYLAAAQNEHFRIRCRAVTGLAAFNGRSPKVIEQLVVCADDSHHKVRTAVLMSLPRLGDDSIALIPVLAKRLFDATIMNRDLVTEHLIRLSRSQDDLMAHSLSLVLGGVDPADRLRALLESPTVESHLGESLREICRRRLEWAGSQGSIDVDHVPGQSLTGSIEQVVDAVTSLSRTSRDRRRRRQHLWFIQRIFELLVALRNATVNPRV